MTIPTSVADGVVLIQPQGRIDALTSDPLQAAIDEFLKQGETRIVVDLSSVNLVTSAGLRVLIHTAKQLLRKGKLVLCGLNPTVREVIHIAGFDSFLTICNDLGTAKQKAKEG